MKKQLLPSLVAVAVLGTAALSASAQNLAIVNGKPVPLERVKVLKQQIERSGRQVPAEMEAQIKEEVIAREIFLQEATKRGLDATPEYKQQMDLARQTILIRELFVDYQKKNPVTDADIKAEYDKFVAANAGKEYRASHILVESEDRAKAIIAEVKAGKKFEDIAKKESKDPGSGAQGGDLGWANPGMFVPEFETAMDRLKEREISQPLVSRFGVHLLQVMERRNVELSPAQVRDRLRAELRAQRTEEAFAAWERDVRNRAYVEIREPR